jgi:hypothetical protein
MSGGQSSEQKKLERLCRYISRSAVSGKRLSLMSNGNIREENCKVGDCESANRRAAMTWAQCLKRVFNIDITTCEACGGIVKLIASIGDPAVIKLILEHLEKKAESKKINPLSENRAPPQKGLFG